MPDWFARSRVVPSPQPSTPKRRGSFGLIVVAIAIAASLFRFAIARYSLWFDEQASMFFAAQPIGRLWSGWMIREPNPPLYYSLLKFWMIAFGDTERAVRALSIAAGAGAIAATALLTRQIYGRTAGIVAAALTALSTQQLYYSLQARSYECVYLAASCVLISLVAIERAWRQGRAWSASLPVYAVGCTACIYLHTTMFLLPVICTLAITLVRHRDVVKQPMVLLALMAANLAILLATGWWLDITLQQFVTGAANSEVFDTVTPALVVGKTIGVLTFAEKSGVARPFIAIIATMLAIYQVRRGWSQPETRLLLAVLVIGVTMMGLISVQVPIFLPRTIYWFCAIATPLCAAGLTHLPSRWWAIAGFGTFLAANMATSVETRQAEDWNGAIRRAESVPGSRLIVQSEAMGLLLTTACARLNQGPCPVPIIAVTTPDDRLDRWSAGLYTGQIVAIDRIDTLPKGSYLLFRKEFFHDLIETLHQHHKAHALRDDPALLGPIDRSALIQ